MFSYWWMPVLVLLVHRATGAAAHMDTNTWCCDSQANNILQNDERTTIKKGCEQTRCLKGRLTHEKCPAEEPLSPGEYWVDGDPSAPFPGYCRHKRSGCWRDDIQQWVQVGTEWTAEGCTRAICGENGAAALLPCGLIGLPPDGECRIEAGDPDASYPGCCHHVNCSACWAAELGRSVSVGEKWTLQGCSGQATCRGSGSLSAVGCPLVAVRPGVRCGLDAGDPDSDDFPGCCPKVTCSECYSDYHQRHFGPDEKWTEPGCVLKQCNLMQNDSINVSERQCPLIPDTNCTLVEESGETDFPGCCPTYQCPNHCYSAPNAQYFAIGETWMESDTCARFKCSIGVDGMASVSMTKCGLSPPPLLSSCSLQPGYSGADYPHCCPSYQCPHLCYSRERNQFFQPGDTWTEPPCLRVTCEENGTVGAVTCPAVAAGPGYVEKDGMVGGEYPSCCPRYVLASPPSPPPYFKMLAY